MNATNTPRCHREDELLDSLGRGLVGPELAEHAGSCASCSELRLVAGALLEDRGHAIAESAVPSSGAMWWRMQMRHRQDAQAATRRSLFVGQALTLVIAFALIGSLFGGHVLVGVREVIQAIRVSTPLLLALTTWALVAPFAGWMAVKRK